MITGQQTIEIGEVCCSISFENGFFQDEFDVILSCYRRWGFITEGQSEITITVKETLIPPPHKLNENIFYHSLEYDSVYATMFFDTEEFTGEVGFKIIRFDRFTPVRIMELIETFICNAYLFYFLINEIGTFIHSSGIADGENGYIFAGPSGNGKSTIAKLSLPRTILCDDLVVLRKDSNGKRKVFGTPFYGDSESTNMGIDCKALYFIEKGLTNEVINISKMESAVELMKEGIIGAFLSIDKVQKIYPYSKLLILLVDLLDGIPCYRLRFKEDNTFWKVING